MLKQHNHVEQQWEEIRSNMTMLLIFEKLNPLTNGLFEVRHGMWAELPTNLWANLPTAVRDGLFKEKLGREVGGAGGGGKVALATAPSHQDLCDTHRNQQNWRGKQNRMVF